MQRILLITESLGPGGAERQFCGLATLLTEAGYECRVVTYIDNQYFQPYLEQHEVDYLFAPFLTNKLTRVHRLVKVLKDYKPDVVISYLTHVNVVACLARIFYKCKLIVSERSSNRSYSFADRVHFSLYQLADYVVPNSNSQACFIASHCPSLAGRIVPIVNFVSSDVFVPAVEKRSPDVLKVLTIARYDESKNLLTYLEAIRMSKDLNMPMQFEWYGSNTKDKVYYGKVKCRAHELGIEDLISFNSLSTDVVPLYQNADVFCLPSIYEGYPNTIIEAMSCGLPVICSGVYDNPSIIEDGVNGFLFNPYEPISILGALVKTSEMSNEQRKAMGAKNRTKCMMQNSSAAFLSRYIQLIESANLLDMKLMAGHRITILVVSNEHPRPDRPSNPIVQRLITAMHADERVELVDFVPFTNNIANFGKIRKIAKNADVLQIHFGGIYAFLVWLAVIGVKVPKFITFHGTDIHMGELAFESNPLKRLKIRLNQQFSFISLLCFDGCSFVDEALMRYIPERLCAKTKHKYSEMRLGVDYNIFQPMLKQQAREILGIASGKIQVLFSDLTGYQVKRRDLAEKIVRELGGGYDLLIMSRVHPDLVPVYLNASDFLLLTSATEGSPNIVREALALNVPVFSVDVGDVAQQIAGLKNSSIIPRDPMKASQLIREKMELKEDEDTRRLLRDRIDIEQIARRIIDIYLNYDKRNN